MCIKTSKLITHMTAKIEEILNRVNFFLTQSVTTASSRSEYFTAANVFKRRSKLTFEKLCYFLIRQPKKSLSIELEDFFSELKEEPCTKSAVSKARYKIKPVFFRDWHTHIVSVIYGVLGTGMKRWNGLRVKAVDGTTLHLFDAEGIVDEFGGIGNQFCLVPAARAVFEVDVLNGFCTQTAIGNCLTDETVLSRSFLENSGADDLIIYDRLYPSFELIYRHLKRNVPFLMRCKVSFNKVVKDFVESGCTDRTVKFKITDKALKKLKGENFDVRKGQTVEVRLLRIDIGGDEPEILVTGLSDALKFKYAAFKDLYFLRRGVETFIDKMKNKHQTELFSGHKAEAVYQDFFADVIAANMHELFCFSCVSDLEKVNELNTDKELPEQKINKNVTIGIYRQYAVKLYLGEKQSKTIGLLKKKFMTHLIQILHDRHEPRKKKQRNTLGKYKTLTNYRKCL